MKKYTLSLTVVVAALLVGTSAYAQSTPSPSPTPTSKGDCRQSSWNTEIYGFCGAKAAMLEKLASLPVQLLERRVFIQITQGSSNGEVKLYERQQDGTFTVTNWTTGQTFGLLADIDKAIFDNKGVNCTGEQVTAIVSKKLGRGEVSKGVAAPVSPAAAFSHSVKDASGEFITTRVLFFC